jgi:hypothetical protein
VVRSAAVFVAVDDIGSDRPHADVDPVHGTSGQIADRLAEFDAAGVDEAILVLSPITENAIRSLRDVVASFSGPRDGDDGYPGKQSDQRDEERRKNQHDSH